MRTAAASVSAGHLVFAGGYTTYILIGLHFEEDPLIQIHGENTVPYPQTTSKLLPMPTAHGRAQAIPAMETL